MATVKKLTLRDVNTTRTRKKKLDRISDAQLKADHERMSVAYQARLYKVSKTTLYRRLREAGLVNGNKESEESDK